MSETKKMPYVRLGNSGLKVSKIILGCMQFGDPVWQGWVLNEEEAIKHIKYAYDSGIQTFDVANVTVYSHGVSEVILGNAIKKLSLPRDEIVIMTKVFFPMPRQPRNEAELSKLNPDDVGLVNRYGLSRKHIFDSVKESLQRLQVDYIDVLQCHRFDYNTPIAETMQALDDVIKAGYVRYVGMSSCYAYQFQAMQNYAINHNLTPFISMQNQYSLLYREEEREMFPTLKMFGVGSIPWSPLARGVLARPWNAQTKRATADPWMAFATQETNKPIVDRVEEIAKKRGISMAQVSTAWLLSKEGVTAPIIGPSSLEKLKDNIAAIHVKLTEEEIKYLEEPYRVQGIDGHS